MKKELLALKIRIERDSEAPLSAADIAYLEQIKTVDDLKNYTYDDGPACALAYDAALAMGLSKSAAAEIAGDNRKAAPATSMDSDSGLGIGGINNDQSMPIIPSVRAIERVQRMHDTDTVCKRCGQSANFDGAMFTTLGGSNICDDCA